MDHQVCLKWNNFQSSFTSTLEELWDEDSFCDVTLWCENQEIRAHKVILSACSLTFKSLLKNNVCKHPIIILNDIKLGVLEAILQFIYKGEVNIEQDQLSVLLRTASSLQINGLAGVTEEENKVKPESLLSKKSKTSNFDNSSLKNHNVGPKRKKPKISLQIENQETILVTPKEELLSEDEVSNAAIYNSDAEQESDYLNGVVRKEVIDCNREDPLMMEPCTNVPTAEFISNSSQGISFNYFSVTLILTRILTYQFTAFTCSNVQFPPFPCPFCHRAYASWGFRRRHIKALHTGSPKLTCKWCSVILASQEDWESHVINEHHLSRSEAEQGLKVLEEAHMVLQNSNVFVSVFKEDAARSLNKK